MKKVIKKKSLRPRRNQHFKYQVIAIRGFRKQTFNFFTKHPADATAIKLLNVGYIVKLKVNE